MPRLGTYTYPHYDLQKIRIAVKELAEMDGKASLTALAQKLRMSEKGGAFNYLVAALVDYGVATRSKNEIALTDLGKRIAKPLDDKDLNDALVEAFLNVPLFRRLYEKCGNKLPDDTDLMAYLIDITGQDRISVSKAAPTIRRIYSSIVNLLPPLEKKEEEVTPTQTQVTRVAPTIGAELPEGVLARFILKDVGYVDIKDKDTYSIVEAYMRVLKKKLGILDEESE